MAAFVLVHGAWHGGWCWERVVPLLEARGHRVFAPTLTGLAERSHLLIREINLSTHVDDVVDLITGQDLQDVVLAGHSYAGQVVAGVARHVRRRLRRVVYLDANLPMPGETGLEAGLAFGLKDLAEDGDGWRIPVPAPENGQLMGVTDPADIRWLLDNLTDHPLATFEEPVHLDKDDPHPVPGSYVLCTRMPRPRAGTLRNAQRARELGWPVFDIDTGHDLMVTEPARTAEVLLHGVT